VPKCNGRKTGNGDLPKRDPGEWAGEGYCKQPLGWGTDHPGEGRCKHHNGAPKGNKNALKTGEHETILYDTMGEDERHLWESVDTDHLAQVNKQIRTNKIRQRRMMQRIADLKGEGMTLVERQTEEGHVGEGPIDVTRESETDALERIQEIEDALTRVQKELRKLLREKYRILKDQPVDHSEKLDELLSRMALMREDATDYEPPDLE
jgi:uncharacterized protein YjcR